MKLPLSWLKQYINVSLTPEKLADALTMSGTKVEETLHEKGEAVLEIEITTNRPDCLSILGLAREVSALTHQKITFPKITKSALRHGKTPKIQVLDKKACPLYTAKVIENVTIKLAPKSAQDLLELAGTRAINNVVDATNFVLFETGQPLHAFDADKIKGGTIIVRRAKKGEKFLGIDGVEYTLEEKTLVIADAERPIALAGVIGGRLTEVTASTKNILLESAYFDPGLVREASRFYKISTDSSYRFERGVDRDQVAQASARARDLILEWAGGQETGSAFQGSAEPSKTPKILLRAERVEKLLGMKVPLSRMSAILKSLGLAVEPQGQRLTVTSPSFRRDLALEADLIEEVLRIEGFEKIPALLPATRHTPQALSRRPERLFGLKKFIATLGFSEIITYSFLSEKAVRGSALAVEGPDRAHRLVNALSGELQYFRQSLLPGMLESVIFNVHRKAPALKFFEIGNRLVKGAEETALSLCLYGPEEQNWLRKSESSFFDLKGAVERVLRELDFKKFEWKENAACPKYSVSSSLYSSGKKLGTLGILSFQVQKNWDLPHEVIYFEMALDPALSAAEFPETRELKPIAKFPSVRRDIAFVIDRKIPVEALEALITGAGAPHLKEVSLFDEYSGKNIASGKRSLAFSLSYQKETGTFTDEEIQSLQAKVGEALKNNYKVEFR